MEQDKKISGSENPEHFTGLRLGKISKIAAGVPAVMISFKQVFGEAGLFRGWKALHHLNQKGGFDCPSCAWPDPDDERSGIAEYCENGAKAIAEEATSKKLSADFFKANAVAELAQLSDYEIGRKGRIAEPIFLAKGATHYAPISWDAAFGKIAAALNNLSSPREAVFYTSGRTSNEAAFLYQLFAKAYGTNNMPDCSNMCHESTSVALNESLGLGKASIKMDDLYQAEVIIIIGQNPGTNHPRMLTALQKGKRNGATIISINPLPEAGLMGFNDPQTVKGIFGLESALTDLFLPVKITGDMALLKALQWLLLEAEEKDPGQVLDKAFINEKTEGYMAWKENILKEDINELQRISGVDMAEIETAANILATYNKIVVCWAMGLTQQEHAVNTIKEVVNLLLMKGSIGKPGAGTCPVRGHSNVQGDRTMGIYEKPAAEFLDKLATNFSFDPPRQPGYDTVDSIKAMHDKKVKVFFAMGGNFLSATPDTGYTANAIRQTKLTVQVSTKLNRSHLIHGEEAIILPCLARSDKDSRGGKEQFVSCENTTGVVQSSQGVLEPISNNLLSETAIVCRLAKATLKPNPAMDWDAYENNYDLIRDAIEKTIPGFDDYNLRVRLPGGFYLPNPNREGDFATKTKKAQFHVAPVADIKLASDELMMMTMRSHDQFNTTIYGLDDRYRGIYNERRVIFMNQGDMNARGLKLKDVVDIFSYFNGEERIARSFIVVHYPIPAGCTATYYPETNVLVPIGSVAAQSNTPTSKQLIVKVKLQSPN